MKYRKKPVIVEAVQWTGSNVEEIEPLTGCSPSMRKFKVLPDGLLMIRTLEGDMIASKGDYIIKGIQGEFYPCKPDIFEAIYEAVV